MATRHTNNLSTRQMYREQPARIISRQANTDVREEPRATYNFKGTLVEVAPTVPPSR